MSFLEDLLCTIQQTECYKELQDATISDPALDKMVEDGAEVMRLMDRDGKLCFLLFLLGSSEEVLKEIKSVPILQEVT